jgi:hypothetical protein
VPYLTVFALVGGVSCWTVQSYSGGGVVEVVSFDLTSVNIASPYLDAAVLWARPTTWSGPPSAGHCVIFRAEWR